MVVIRDSEFRVVARSRNLRGILDYSRKHAIDRVDIWKSSRGGAQLGITWADGSSCITDFADSSVCKAWCAKRRAFPAATLHQ